MKYITKMKNEMHKQPAKILRDGDLCRLLKAISHTRDPVRNSAIVLLSFHAGLRACEIAGLTWPMALAPSGKLSGSLSLCGGITKGGRPRTIPISKRLIVALKNLHRQSGRPENGPVIRSERGGAMTPRSIVNWFHQAYDGLGLAGCSSHSGRRTFITKAARILPKVNGSLRDIQELAGHAALSTTERYIQGDRTIQRKLVNLI
jgi:integrase